MYDEALNTEIVDTSCPEPNTGCFLWCGWLCNRTGYGSMYVRSLKRMYRAHRAAWQAIHGPIPEVLYICHRCDTRACVNIEHLFLGSYLDNVIDMVNKNRQARGPANGAAKLVDADIPRIRKMSRAGKSRVAVAKKFGVSPSAISLVMRNLTWSHVQ